MVSSTFFSHIFDSFTWCSLFVILSTNSPGLFRLSGSSSIAVWSPTRQIAGRWRVREYLDNDSRQELGFTRVCGFLKCIHTVSLWVIGLTTSQAEYSSIAQRLLQRSSCCISPLSTRNRCRKVQSPRYKRRRCGRCFVSRPLVTINLMLSRGPFSSRSTALKIGRTPA